MYVPIYQGLSAIDFVRPVPARAATFPFDHPHALYFYRARNAIYHLFRELVAAHPGLTVLAPDYNSGNEILAMRAAGATIRYYTVGRDMCVDPAEIERLCAIHRPDLLYVIHYVGWPQPMPALADLCRRREMLLVEDCALALLSALDERPLGTFGHWAVFCLYKTLPVPNGAVLVQNAARIESLERLPLRDAGVASQLARTLELLAYRARGRASAIGSALQGVKRGLGLAAGALGVHRANVGDIGFTLDEVDLAMSGLSSQILGRLDFNAIVRKRIDNFQQLAIALDGVATPVHRTRPAGTCPLFFPILVPDKHEAAIALRRRGVDALEFWNHGAGGEAMSADTRFLRQHVLELPIHQDLAPRHVAHMAQQVRSVSRGMA
jgi:perosamine synthetase